MLSVFVFQNNKLKMSTFWFVKFKLPRSSVVMVVFVSNALSNAVFPSSWDLLSVFYPCN